MQSPVEIALCKVTINFIKLGHECVLFKVSGDFEIIFHDWKSFSGRGEFFGFCYVNLRLSLYCLRDIRFGILSPYSFNLENNRNSLSIPTASVYSDRFGCHAQSDHLKVGKLGDNTRTGHIPLFIVKILTKDFVLLSESCIFAPLEPAKPLNDAQIGGSFFIIGT